MEAYSDSDYAGANIDRKSTTGCCQFLGRRLISWQCKKQTIVATFTTEAEYVAAANCCRQVLLIQNQMLDYGFNFMNTKIYIANESTICIVKNLVFHSKTKHIEIRHHFIRDAYEKKLIQVLKIHTDDNVADLLTKAFDVHYDLWKVNNGRPKLSTARPKLSTDSTKIESMKLEDMVKEKRIFNKELASPKQTALGKHISNPLIVDSLLKTIWLSMHHVIAMKHWLFQSKRLLNSRKDGASLSLDDEEEEEVTEGEGQRNCYWDDHQENLATIWLCKRFLERMEFEGFERVEMKFVKSKKRLEAYSLKEWKHDVFRNERWSNDSSFMEETFFKSTVRLPKFFIHLSCMMDSRCAVRLTQSTEI
ncbi:hypothetical protein Tco_0111155 [Tanacetum coccineum]